MKNLLLGAALLLFSGVAFAIPGLPIPENIDHSRTDISVDFAWDPVEGAVSYDVYRDGQYLTTVLDTFFSDATSPDAGAAYFLTACQANGECSDGSPTVHVMSASGGGMTGDGCPVLPITVPINVGYTLNDSGGATVYWDAIPGMDSYLLHVNDEYFAATGDTSFVFDSFDVDSVYQVSAVQGDNFFPRSEAATEGASSGGNELADAIARATAAESDLAACAVDRDTLTDELNDANARIAELEAGSSTDPTVAELQEQLAAANAELAEANDTIEDQTSMLAVLAEDIVAHETRAAEDLAQIAELESQLADANTLINDQEELLIEVVASNSELQAYIDENCPIEEVAAQ